VDRMLAFIKTRNRGVQRGVLQTSGSTPWICRKNSLLHALTEAGTAGDEAVLRRLAWVRKRLAVDTWH
jgi:hypothetical protein